jgi:beta-galactosidase
MSGPHWREDRQCNRITEGEDAMCRSKGWLLSAVLLLNPVLMSSVPLEAATLPAAPRFDTILYGAAYYNEYMPAAIQRGRLEKDVALMKSAGITVVRMGESSWGKWEPSDGNFDFAWMDGVVNAMGKAGIKVILGTPTYSIPVWMFAKHPDMLARPLNGGETGYGMRQNMNIDDPDYRRYAERIIVTLARHYRDNPTVIGWQLDNETTGYGASNLNVFKEFVEWLQAKYHTIQALNDAWLLSYWGQNVAAWEDMPTRDKATSPSYKLDWARFQQWRASQFIAWQANLIRQHARSDQFLSTNHASLGRPDVNEVEMEKPLNVVSDDIYFEWQDTYNGEPQALQGDFARSVHHRNYVVAETNAQTQGWDATRQLPPYDGQMYQDVFGHIASGANMVEYWHWHSIHGGQETYWKGVLSHDLEPNRLYAEVSKIGNDLKRVGPSLVDLRKTNEVAILYSADSSSALSFMPYATPSGRRQMGVASDGYSKTLQQLHSALFNANIETDIVYADGADFSGYGLLIVPSLYCAEDALLQKISKFVEQGGHVIMTFKSGFTNENSLVRWELAPGPLRRAAGFKYQEVSTLLEPLKLKNDPFGATQDNVVKTIAEFLQPETAEVLAYYDHPFFGKWPAITRNSFGKGTLLYEGTELSDGLQAAVVREELRRIGLFGRDQELAETVRVKHATSRTGQALHFFFNYSPDPITFNYPYGPAAELLSQVSLKPQQPLKLAAWGVAIAEERSP